METEAEGADVAVAHSVLEIVAPWYASWWSNTNAYTTVLSFCASVDHKPTLGEEKILSLKELPPHQLIYQLFIPTLINK